MNETKFFLLASSFSLAVSGPDQGWGHGNGRLRFILSLYGQQATYRLGARLNGNDALIAAIRRAEAKKSISANDRGRQSYSPLPMQ
jgi:hypothetical protein